MIYKSSQSLHLFTFYTVSQFLERGFQKILKGSQISSTTVCAFASKSNSNQPEVPKVLLIAKLICPCSHLDTTYTSLRSISPYTLLDPTLTIVNSTSHCTVPTSNIHRMSPPLAYSVLVSLHHLGEVFLAKLPLLAHWRLTQWWL